MNELTRENFAIGKIESHYMRKKRNVIYTSLEGVEDTEWFWSPSEVRKFKRLWDEGKPIKEMAIELRRSETAIFLLALDKIAKGSIRPRDWKIW